MKLVSVLALTSCAGIAGGVEVGTGVNSAGVYIEWSDGFYAEFEVSFGSTATDTMTGLALLEELDVADSIGFTLTTKDWDWGITIEGMEYVESGVTHYDPGWVDGEDWWHYWIKDVGESSWSFSLEGAVDRIVENGDWNGWIYGHDDAPIPEPTTIALLGLGAVLARRSRK